MFLFDVKQNYSDVKLEFALKNNILEEYIMMLPSCTNDNKDLKYDRVNIMKSIYKYHKKHPKDGIDEILYNTLIKISKEYPGERGVNSVLDTVKYQLYYEKNGKASFNMDCKSVLNTLRETIVSNKDIYTQRKKMFNKPFWDTIQDYNQELSEEYGHKVL